MKHLITILFVIGCASPTEEPEPVQPDLRVILEMEYQVFVDRLVRDHTENGWVVSKYENGSLEHLGDSLLWTGLAMAVVPCETGEVYANAIRRMLKDNGGSMIRFHPLPDEYKGGREVSFDGATGVYFGILARLLDCDDDPSFWAPVWEMHMLAMESHNGRLHPNVPLSEADVVPEFTVLPDYISHLLGMRGKPDDDRLAILEKQVEGWARLVVFKKESCYRIHLGWLYLRSLERLNSLAHGSRDRFCGATESTDIPLIDHWCGRSHISNWEFEPNTWEYRHQRCGKWETPDGKPKLATPGLDIVFGYHEGLRK